MPEGGVMRIDEPPFGSSLSQKLSSFDFYGDDPVQISEVQAPSNQLPKELIFIPALLLLGLVAFLQSRRAKDEEIMEGETA
jgi:hypothetical protein